MLKITVPATESYDPISNTFFTTKEQVLTLEHSLLSISKWESKWEKPFLDRNTKKTIEESRDYIRCMTITQNVDPDVYYALTDNNYQEIIDYMSKPMTATWFKNDNKPPSRKIITAEIIYYYMVALQIPFSCEKWHFNKLMTLIRVCNEENKPNKKMSKREIMANNRALNEARRAKMKSKG